MTIRWHDLQTAAAADLAAEGGVAVLHTCAGREHVVAIQPTRTLRLGCGCTKAIGVRCDGTPVEWIATAVCARHRDEETAAGSHSPADATPSDAPRARDEGSQRPARSTKPGPGLGVTPTADWQWRYLVSANGHASVLHALHPAAKGLARCGAAGQWRGDGNQVDRDRAAGLARCGRCMRFIEAKGVGGWL
ncbi:MAG: hypothetical protein ACM30G_09005 [Micromonosporaceae bacterium]